MKQYVKMVYNHETPCCIYNGIFHPSCKIYPRDGKWTIQNMYDIMKDCELDEDLVGVKPLDISEGGFQWIGTQDSIDLWHSTTCARDYPRTDCTMTRQIRTYNVDSHFYDTHHINNWKEELPNHEDLHKPMSITPHFFRNTLELPYIELRCKGNPSFKMFIKMIMLFHKHGHTIMDTTGFKIDFNTNIVKRCKGKIYVSVKVLRAEMKRARSLTR